MARVISKVFIIGTGGRSIGKELIRKQHEMEQLKTMCQEIGMKHFDDRESYDDLKSRYDTYKAFGFENLPMDQAWERILKSAYGQTEALKNLGIELDRETIKSIQNLNTTFEILFEEVKEVMRKLTVIFGDIINSDEFQKMAETLVEIAELRERYIIDSEPKPYTRQDAYRPIRNNHQWKRPIMAKARRNLRK